MSKTRRLFWFFSVCLKQQSCFLLSFFFFFKVFTGFVTIASASCFGFWPWGTWDQGLNSHPCIGRTARENRVSSFLNQHLTCLPESQRSAFSRRPQTRGHGQGGPCGPGEDRRPDADTAVRGADSCWEAALWHGGSVRALCRPRWQAGVGGRLKRERIHVYWRRSHAVVQQKLTQCCKAIILQ